jgi:hypothetical protein
MCPRRRSERSAEGASGGSFGKAVEGLPAIVAELRIASFRARSRCVTLHDFQTVIRAGRKLFDGTLRIGRRIEGDGHSCCRRQVGNTVVIPSRGVIREILHEFPFVALGIVKVDTLSMGVLDRRIGVACRAKPGHDCLYVINLVA